MGMMAYSCTWRSARWRREGDGELAAAAVTDIGAFRAAFNVVRPTGVTVAGAHTIRSGVLLWGAPVFCVLFL